jgi:hypothetical protein
VFDTASNNILEVAASLVILWIPDFSVLTTNMVALSYVSTCQKQTAEMVLKHDKRIHASFNGSHLTAFIN